MMVQQMSKLNDYSHLKTPAVFFQTNIMINS